MENKNVAISGIECYNSLRFLSSSFNIKLLDDSEEKNIEDDWANPFGYKKYNPFNEPAYWIWITGKKLIKKDFRIRGVPQKIIYVKLVKSSDLRSFPPNVEFSEFTDNFFVKRKKWDIGIHRQVTIRHPKNIKGIEELQLRAIETHFDDYNYDYEKEKYSDYFERCLNSYKTNFIYIITIMISSTLDVEMEYRNLPSIFMLQNNSKMGPTRIWSKYESFPDSKNIPFLKDLTLELCSYLEKKGVTNYRITPFTDDIDIDLALELDANLSWGD